MTGLRDEYNRPPETPREAMWSVIQSRLGVVGSPAREAGHAPEPGEHGSSSSRILSLDSARRARNARLAKALGWAGAAAALLVLGLGIGRMTAPAPEVAVDTPAAVDAPGAAEGRTKVLRAASVAHLLRTESMLTLVQSDGRAGRLEPTVGQWARSLLGQTRLLMDAQGSTDPEMRDLLEDLELVLAQILGAANATQGDPGQLRAELNLALQGIEQHEVLNRIQAVVPAGPRFVGT